MLKNEHNRLKFYQDKVADTTQAIEVLTKLINRLSMARLLLMAIEVLFFVLLASAKTDGLIYLFCLLLLVPIVLFVIVVRKQNVVDKDLSFHKNLLWVYQNEISIINGDKSGYDDGHSFEDDLHAYSSDFDVFGASSLYALINRCFTKIGKAELAKHLSAPSEKAKILNRQAASSEILQHIGDTFDFRANLKGNDVDRIEEIKRKLSHQLREQVSFTKNKWLRAYVKTVPYVMGILFFAALVFGGKLWSIFTLFTFANAILTYAYAKKITTVYYGFSGSANLLNSYADAIHWTEKVAWESTYIKSFFTSPEKVSAHIKKLSKIIVAFDARLNFLLYAILNFFLLWDLKCCIKLGDWNAEASDKVSAGLDRIGYFEELISFATLSFNHPHWVFPVIEDEFSFNASAMGHPLIHEAKRINNDYQFSSAPTVDIVTGSNMAGKSTFLRTVGVNLVLAYAGASVSATSMRASVFRLLSYMRIKDNLIENTSTFKAELNRLKMILSEVAQHDDSLVLIDEMLRGTNSKDKFEGSSVFIEKLVAANVPMLFATHDLQLSELAEKYPTKVRNFHFDIQLIGSEMEFDYLIKKGPCTQFNAAILLKQIGLA